MDLGSEHKAGGPSPSTKTCFGKSMQVYRETIIKLIIWQHLTTNQRCLYDSEKREGCDNFHIWHGVSFIRADFNKSPICSSHGVSGGSWWTSCFVFVVRSSWWTSLVQWCHQPRSLSCKWGVFGLLPTLHMEMNANKIHMYLHLPDSSMYDNVWSVLKIRMHLTPPFDKLQLFWSQTKPEYPGRAPCQVKICVEILDVQGLKKAKNFKGHLGPW